MLTVCKNHVMSVEAVPVSTVSYRCSRLLRALIPIRTKRIIEYTNRHGCEIATNHLFLWVPNLFPGFDFATFFNLFKVSFPW